MHILGPIGFKKLLACRQMHINKRSIPASSEDSDKKFKINTVLYK